MSLQMPIIDYIRVKTRGSSPRIYIAGNGRRALFNENRFDKLGYIIIYITYYI